MAEKIYTTLAGDGKAELEEKRSHFIGYAKRVCTEAEAAEFIKSVKAENYDAKHNTYAYVIGDSLMRYSDDGEPQGTAGLPILGVIQKNKISDAVIVVTRYFGGILLGTGGLVRAYTSAAKSALENAGIVTYTRYIVFSINLSYSEYQKLAPELEKFGAIVDSTDFLDDVRVVCAVKHSDECPFTAKISEIFGGRARISRLCERFDGKK